MGKACVFFDRDGVLNVDKDFVFRTDDFQWIPGARECILELNRRGILVIVVTNQSGIARGYFSEADFHQLSAHMQKELGVLGARIDEIYFCPHHPTEGQSAYKKICECRKPAPGMLLQAIKKWSIDLERSVLVGDKSRDLEAARAAGIRSLYYDQSEALDSFVLRNLDFKEST